MKSRREIRRGDTRTTGEKGYLSFLATQGEVVLGDCAAVRGILNNSQGGPLRPPGLRMSEALQDVRDSLDRNLQAQKGGLQSRC